MRLSKKRYQQYKEEARKVIRQRLDYYAALYGVSYNRLSIRNQKSRWGSCSEHGNLNFNVKLLFLSDHLRDYVIIHEVCHLLEMNHSAQFWRLVEKACPDYTSRRKELHKII